MKQDATGAAGRQYVCSKDIEIPSYTDIGINVDTQVIAGIDQMVIDFVVPGKTNGIEVKFIFKDLYIPGITRQVLIVGKTDIIPVWQLYRDFIEAVISTGKDGIKQFFFASVTFFTEQFNDCRLLENIGEVVTANKSQQGKAASVIPAIIDLDQMLVIMHAQRYPLFAARMINDVYIQP